MSKLTHLDDSGAAHMVDVSAKPDTDREAVAEGRITMSAEALAAIRKGSIQKGDVLATARIAGIMAAKKTSELIPLCHPLMLSRVSVDFAFEGDGVRITALVRLTGQTGVEMEAMTAVAVALLTIYDMAKALDKSMVISDIRLLSKSGGKSGKLARVIGVDEAQARLLALATPLPAIEVPVAQAVGHYLAEDVIAKRTQPAADLSAMDGYAIRFADMPGPWRVIGESSAGRPFQGPVGGGDAVRIFTGAHVPGGADSILVQEATASDGETLTLTSEGPSAFGSHIRSRGMDFSAGDRLLEAGTRLNAGAIAAAVMAGFGSLVVGGRPRISIIASGDELVFPGDPCDDARIPSSNSVMLSAMLDGLPCIVEDKGIVADSLHELEAIFGDCSNSDIIVATGGASVGDHDFVQQALNNVGAEIDFWKVAMRPGKPLLAGGLGSAIVLGLPGNPSSAFVTAFLFLLPLVRHLSGSTVPLLEPLTAPLGSDLPAGGERTDYFRARHENGLLTMLTGQDSGRVAPLSNANALVINPARCASRISGTQALYFRID